VEPASVISNPLNDPLWSDGRFVAATRELVVEEAHSPVRGPAPITERSAPCRRDRDGGRCAQLVSVGSISANFEQVGQLAGFVVASMK
jgi:hypothetical protein